MSITTALAILFCIFWYSAGIFGMLVIRFVEWCRDEADMILDWKDLYYSLLGPMVLISYGMFELLEWGEKWTRKKDWHITILKKKP